MTALTETATSPSQAPARAKTAWLALSALGIAIFNAFAMRAVFAPVQEMAKADLGISDFQISLVQGLAASIPIALLSVPLGAMTDRGNRMRILLVLGVTWTVGTLATAFVTDFYMLFVARMLASIGAMCAVPVAISIAADLGPPENRGRALLVLSLGNMAGVAAAFAFGGAALGALNAAPLFEGLTAWRGVHVLFAIASLVLLLPLLLIREPARQEVGASANLPLRDALAAIWRMRPLLAPLFLGQVSVVMADTAAGIWAAPVLSRNYGLAPEEFAGWMGLVILASGLIGSIMGGLLADAGHKSRIKGGILIGAVIAAFLSIPGAFFPLMPDATSFAWVLALFLACGAITGLVTATSVAVLVPNELRGVCLATFMVVASIIGLGIAPTLVTLISDAFGGEGAIRYGLAATGAATSIAAAIGFSAAMINAARREA
ncbi:MAG: MFS transporter [Hyphomonadaceae bacterium]|nr:MFS transporter [Hyphomonadaceae bacterium]